MRERIAEQMCRLFGHKPKNGDLHRSPYTSYTHLRDVNCERCGENLDRIQEYHDARTEPELFRPV